MQKVRILKRTGRKHHAKTCFSTGYLPTFKLLFALIHLPLHVNSIVLFTSFLEGVLFTTKYKTGPQLMRNIFERTLGRYVQMCTQEMTFMFQLVYTICRYIDASFGRCVEVGKMLIPDHLLYSRVHPESLCYGCKCYVCRPRVGRYREHPTRWLRTLRKMVGRPDESRQKLVVCRYESEDAEGQHASCVSGVDYRRCVHVCMNFNMKAQHPPVPSTNKCFVRKTMQTWVVSKNLMSVVAQLFHRIKFHL